MSGPLFPSLQKAGWQDTRDTIHGYAKVLGMIRKSLSPRQKHWWHVSLRIEAGGLTTTSIPSGDTSFEIILDLPIHKLIINTVDGKKWETNLQGQPASQLCLEMVSALNAMGIHPDIDCKLLSDWPASNYDISVAKEIWQSLSQLDAILKQFKEELPGETSPSQLWPHHFDLSMVWFSGRLVPGIDPADEENAAEQMNFGFSFGDQAIKEPYFYITAYPWQNGLLTAHLPEGATWHTESFSGAMMKYDTLVSSKTPKDTLFNFLRFVQQAGAHAMA